MTRIGRLMVRAGAIAALVAGVWLYSAHQARQDERQAAKEAALADSTRWADSVEALRRAADSAARAQDVARQREAQRLQLIAVGYKRRGDSLTALLRPLVPDSAQPLLDAIGAACTAAVAAVDSARTLERRRVASCQLRLAAADSSVQRFHALSHAWQKQAEFWKRRARPPLFSLRRVKPGVGCGVQTASGLGCLAGFFYGF